MASPEALRRKLTNIIVIDAPKKQKLIILEEQ